MLCVLFLFVGGSVLLVILVFCVVCYVFVCGGSVLLIILIFFVVCFFSWRVRVTYHFNFLCCVFFCLSGVRVAFHFSFLCCVFCYCLWGSCFLSF